MLQTTDINSVEKKNKASAIYVDESLGMIDRDAQYDQEDGRLCLHLSSFEMPASKSLAQGTSSRDNGKGKKRVSTYPEAIRTSLLGPKDEKSKEASQLDSGEEYASETADSGDSSSLNADNYSCLVEVNGRDFLELSESWRHLLKRPAGKVDYFSQRTG